VFKEGRPNIKITYAGSGSCGRCTGFIGSHMDVVPANPETWDRDPFTLQVEGDKLFGRGTTDCMGHVGMITLLMKAIAQQKPDLQRSIVVLFIAGEEGGETGVGVDMVVKGGKIDELKNGTCFWIDSADSQPCVGTAGSLTWHIKTHGRLFHSGLPHRGINSLELGMEAVKQVQLKFYEDFPPHPDEIAYNFATPSTMKPTQMECAQGSLNQIPPWATISGDIRLTPFYDAGEVMKKVESYVKEINDKLGVPGECLCPMRGPCSKWVLDSPEIDEAHRRGRIELTWGCPIEEVRNMEGIACNLKSAGLKAITDATAEVKGEAKPYAITGSLPLVRMMQDAGFDIQITGYGLSTVYHADNEYALLSDMKDAFQILLRVISIQDRD